MEYIKGITWGWPGVRGTLCDAKAQQSFDAMCELGINWVTLAFQGLQDRAQSTTIDFSTADMVSDEELVQTIERAHAWNLRVCLKPVVNCRDGTWRAHICFFDEDVPGEPTWAEWFQSYERFILHYARLAEKTGCEMFCVGCEMVQADKRVAEWRQLISKVREVYSGLVTYNCDKYQEERVQWWDAVDVVSSSGYYPLSRWNARVQELRAFARRVGKPVFFMEAGCPSRSGSAERPNDWQHPGSADVAEQERYYLTMFDALKDEPWFYGFMLWDWPAHLYARESAFQDTGYCVYGKPAERVVAEFYRSR